MTWRYVLESESLDYEIGHGFVFDNAWMSYALTKRHDLLNVHNVHDFDNVHDLVPVHDVSVQDDVAQCHPEESSTQLQWEMTLAMELDKFKRGTFEWPHLLPQV